MIVRNDEVTLTKKELEECIIKCSAEVASDFGFDNAVLILTQALIAIKVSDKVTKKIFGEEK